MCPFLISKPNIDFFVVFFFLSDHLSLMKKVAWAVNGLVPHNGVKQKKTKPVISNCRQKITKDTSDRILMFKNCTGQDNYETIASQNQIEKVTFFYQHV